MQPSGAPTGRQSFTQEFAFAGDVDSVAHARDTVVGVLQQHGISDEEEIDVTVALQEGLANAALHGCGDDAGKTIHCTVQVDPAEINIVIRDPGEGFDTSAALDSTNHDANLGEHGRGILLMRSLMDEINYRHGGSELHMKKRRKQSA